MAHKAPAFSVRLAESEADLRAAQALRYRVFVTELGGGGAMVDHAAGLERDRFDPFFDHLLLEHAASGAVVGVYRVMRGDQARAAGQFYSEDEYDIGALKRSGRRLLELGRSCVDARFRGGLAMYHLWSALGDYVARHRIEILFGAASFHGTDPARLAQPLSLLHQAHLAPPELRVSARADRFQSMDLVPPAALDRAQAMREMPPLIKAYLRIGGHVGQGACIDREFNTTDVCLILDTKKMNARQRRIYAKDNPA